MPEPTKDDLKKTVAALKGQLKENRSNFRLLEEENAKLRGAPREEPEIRLPAGVSTYEELLEEFHRRGLVIIAQEEKLGWGLPAEYEGVVLPQVRENALHQQLERDFRELNASYKKLYDAKRKEGVDVSEVMEPPKIIEKPQDDKPVDCNSCGLRVPDRHKGAKQDPSDGMWYCEQNGCAAERNLA